VAGNKIQFQELNKFPTVRRDLALVLDKSVTSGKSGNWLPKNGSKTVKRGQFV
jgi:phenylalanyl-tRNA synthetase beta subunit